MSEATHKPITALTIAQSRVRALVNVLHALMIRDIQTRFGSPLGFSIVILWPLSHVLLLLLIASFFRLAPPYGDSLALWYAIGVTYFMIFNYMSRFIMMGLVQNKPLLNFSVISAFNILLARVLTETLVAFALLFCLALIALGAGIRFMPTYPDIAFAALLVTLVLGVGFGLFNAILAAVWAPWAVASILFNLFLWFTAGVYFIPAEVPQEIQYWLWWNPMIHPIEWARTGWYMGYSSSILNQFYPFFLGVTLIFAGLVVDRYFKHVIT